MASTSMSLGKHWEDFIKAQVDSGRYSSATEVVRDALRTFEDKRALESWFDEDMQAAIDSGDAGPVTRDDIRKGVSAMKASMKAKMQDAAA